MTKVSMYVLCLLMEVAGNSHFQHLSNAVHVRFISTAKSGVMMRNDLAGQRTVYLTLCTAKAVH